MSMSLEERRAERRRRRQMEEESVIGTKSADELHADVQERLARRRREREERMANIASSVATVNGEDDFERKRRERREARLRASGDTDYSSTNDYSSRRNRRRGTEDDTSEDTTSTSSYSSYRSRRRRNWDDEETPVVNEEPASSVPDTSEEDAAEERRRRQRQEEEEEARRQAEREEEEERQRQAALEEERQRQREEEEERERQEQQRLREEEEERQRQANEAENESVSEGSSDDDSYNQQRDGNKLFIDEDDGNDTMRGSDAGKHVLSSKLDINVVQSEPKVSDGKNKIEFSVVHQKSLSLDRGSSLEVNNNKIKEKLDKFEHLKDESDRKKSKDKSLIIPIVEKDGFKGKLKKFETEIKDQDSFKDKSHTRGHGAKSVILTPQTHKLSEKLQHFELAAKSQSATRTSARNVQYELEKIGSTQNQRKALLGRWSASETQINKPEVRDTSKRNVLDRWKSVDKQHPQDQQTVKSPTERKEVLSKRLSGNTEYIAAKYLEKATKSIDETTSPKTPLSASQKQSFSQSFEQRLSSPPTEAQSDHSNVNGNQSRSKVTSRWQREDGNFSAVNSETPRSRFSASSNERNGRDSSFDSSAPHSRGSSVDESSGLARKSSCQLEEEEEAERERLRQEEEASEKAARMAAEEGQKKRGKRKGLGGLTPEKKKKLKQIIMQKAAEDLKKEALAKAEEKEKFINERVGPLNTDGLGEAELRKLIKSLHEKLAQIHSESYDIEFKCKKQEQEIVDLNMKISDSRGKFAKPVLRKVNKTEQKFAALSKKQEVKDDFRETLKSAHDEDKN